MCVCMWVCKSCVYCRMLVCFDYVTYVYVLVKCQGLHQNSAAVVEAHDFSCILCAASVFVCVLYH